jgi:hypothetical protein
MGHACSLASEDACRLFPYLVLLRAGFTVPSNVATDAVRSYRTLSPLPSHLAARLGGLLSVALSVDSHPPGVTWRFALGARTFLDGVATTAIV